MEVFTKNVIVTFSSIRRPTSTGPNQPARHFASTGIRIEKTGIRTEIAVPIPVNTANGTFRAELRPSCFLLSPIYTKWRKVEKTNGGLSIERGMNNCCFGVGTQALIGRGLKK